MNSNPGHDPDSWPVAMRLFRPQQGTALQEAGRMSWNNVGLSQALEKKQLLPSHSLCGFPVILDGPCSPSVPDSESFFPGGNCPKKDFLLPAPTLSKA